MHSSSCQKFYGKCDKQKSNKINFRIQIGMVLFAQKQKTLLFNRKVESSGCKAATGLNLHLCNRIKK